MLTRLLLSSCFKQYLFPGLDEGIQENGYGKISKLQTDQNSYLTPIPRIHFSNGIYDNENSTNEVCENTKLLAKNVDPAERTKGCEVSGKVIPSKNIGSVINTDKPEYEFNQRQTGQSIV